MEEFLTFPWDIYSSDPLWVPPLLPELRIRVDRNRGSFFDDGEAEFYLARRDGNLVGTICVAEDKRTNQYRGRRDAIFGFFECVNERQVAQSLIQRAEEWAVSRDLDKLIGPYDLDYEDSYGILIEGRDRPPAVLCGHTPTYYQDLLEGLGFRKAYPDALAYEIDLDPQSNEFRRLKRLGDYVRRRQKVKIRPARLDEFETEVDRVHGLINRALKHLPGFAPWSRDELRATMGKFREIADPELVLFAEVNGQLVGWLPGVPNVNEALAKANGLRRPWDYLRFWWAQRRRPECLAIKSVLVLREHWDTGVPVALFAEMAERASAKGYTWADLSLTSEANPTTPILASNMGARVYKRYRVYGRDVAASAQRHQAPE